MAQKYDVKAVQWLVESHEVLPELLLADLFGAFSLYHFKKFTEAARSIDSFD